MIRFMQTHNNIWVKSESDLGQISTKSLTSSNQSWYARNSSLALIERDIEAIYNHSKAKIKRDKLDESVAQKKRIIIVQQTRNKITAEIKKKRKKWIQALKWEKKWDANAWIKWNKAIAKDFKLTDKSAQKWIDKWITVLNVEYKNETSVEEIVDLLR